MDASLDSSHDISLDSSKCHRLWLTRKLACTGPDILNLGDGFLPIHSDSYNSTGENMLSPDRRRSQGTVDMTGQAGNRKQNCGRLVDNDGRKEACFVTSICWCDFFGAWYTINPFCSQQPNIQRNTLKETDDARWVQTDYVCATWQGEQISAFHCDELDFCPLVPSQASFPPLALSTKAIPKIHKWVNKELNWPFGGSVLNIY